MRSTCTGTTCGFSTRRGWSNAACRSRRCATLSAHASITTTGRCDNQKLENLQPAALELQSGKTFDARAAGGPEGPLLRATDQDPTL
jgi:hypothetical protein